MTWRDRRIFLDDSLGVRTAAFERVAIVPCVVPDPERGRLLPTAEVFDNATGQTAFLVNPVTPRLSFIKGQAAEAR